MKNFTKYQDEHDEFLHPLWLGILLLFIVIVIISISCFIRKKFGSSICHLFNRLCCRNELNNEHNSKTNKHLQIENAYNWAPIFIPSRSVSPKLRTLVRSIRMGSLEKQLSIQIRNKNENNSSENDIFSIVDESDRIQTSSCQNSSQSIQESSNNRNCETARKFYASMRQTSVYQNTMSIDSYDNQPSLSTKNSLMKANRVEKRKNFRTPHHFFRSITYRC
ncbi:unnamed protein product [Rotaria sordida]|uniref:Uncharacterized protein n=1 Tax=Rotaria sordida TaxID=392033 RepID=A0A818LDE9_9BILA|nr:unnamed protein product [Rotaria sordida]CAF3566832.1 unnamed protein product [Rotaria sordida]